MNCELGLRDFEGLGLMDFEISNGKGMRMGENDFA